MKEDIFNDNNIILFKMNDQKEQKISLIKKNKKDMNNLIKIILYNCIDFINQFPKGYHRKFI